MDPHKSVFSGMAPEVVNSILSSLGQQAPATQCQAELRKETPADQAQISIVLIRPHTLS